MRVFSKKKFSFTNPETKQKASVDALAFSNLPEWVKIDPLFAWAVGEGSLEVFNENKKERKKTVEEKTTEDVLIEGAN